MGSSEVPTHATASLAGIYLARDRNALSGVLPCMRVEGGRMDATLYFLFMVRPPGHSPPGRRSPVLMTALDVL